MSEWETTGKDPWSIPILNAHGVEKYLCILKEKVLIERETEKAVLVTFKNEKTWFPKKHIATSNGYVTHMSKWILTQKLSKK